MADVDLRSSQTNHSADPPNMILAAKLFLAPLGIGKGDFSIDRAKVSRVVVRGADVVPETPQGNAKHKANPQRDPRRENLTLTPE
ncbi:hypothetical protein N7447_004489 [Penicillium robsamsonii]|uniref:uncharacterized protein n=1 Tax=Penicillium robsamsonii TaxID=1792511 RepID=UPI002548C42F|nr:uncharacterized protein N7447_004489 [Penicillium robsamsonii]KAJ5827726.1 hypothetical protein N7447_004489 [Penicillium robsamsonii]